MSSETPYAYFCHRLTSSSAVSLATEMKEEGQYELRTLLEKSNELAGGEAGEAGRNEIVGNSRNSLLEPSVRVHAPSNDVSIPEQSKGHVEVLALLHDGRAEGQMRLTQPRRQEDRLKHTTWVSDQICFLPPAASVATSCKADQRRKAL